MSGSVLQQFLQHLVGGHAPQQVVQPPPPPVAHDHRVQQILDKMNTRQAGAMQHIERLRKSGGHPNGEAMRMAHAALRSAGDPRTYH